MGGSFLFKWDHPATEVYVTGTFDNWQKTEKLEKIGDSFQKNVTLADTESKIFYKFVVDGNWVVDHTAPKENDEGGNENNVLTPERIVTEAPDTTAVLSSVAPESSTVAMAGEAPLEKTKEGSELPGAFPETPAADLDKTLSINPMPAAPGAVNPVKLAPGEKIPEGMAAEGTTTDNVKLDPESYEKSDALPGGVSAMLAGSVAPGSTTTALAGAVPLEPKVPAVVKESQEAAKAEPEASAVPEEVQEKAAVEKELLDKVTPAPTTSEGTAGKGTEKTENVVSPGEAAASVAAAATAVVGAAVDGAVAAKDAVAEKATDALTTARTSATSAATQLPDGVKEKLPEPVQSAIGTTAKEETREEVSPEVPAEVKESITKAEEAPEAAAKTEAVREKKAVEAELLKEVKPVEPTAEPPKETTAPAASEGETPATPVDPVKAVPATTEAPSSSVAAATTETPATESTTNGKSATEMSSSKPAENNSAATATATATADKKKKNRISSMFGKVKAKLSHKE